MIKLHAKGCKLKTIIERLLMMKICILFIHMALKLDKFVLIRIPVNKIIFEY